jgi:hypothetical protein
MLQPEALAHMQTANTGGQRLERAVPGQSRHDAGQRSGHGAGSAAGMTQVSTAVMALSVQQA